MNHAPRMMAVTSCSASGFNAYGRRMMQSWLSRWPVQLMVYTEGEFRPPAGALSRAIEGIEWHRRYLAAPYAGERPTDTYRHDDRRFSFKTAAVIDAALTFRNLEYLIWCDADTYTHEPVTKPFVCGLLPAGDEFIAWLHRDRNYPECGFYIIDMQHPLLVSVMEKWRDLYTTGDLYALPEWHDSWVLQWVLQQFPAIKPKSISGAGASTNHPFVNGPLGLVMDHAKGPRKLAGRTPKHERTTRDGVAYWKR